ncbi:MAG: hypothetical protein K0S71_144 [Clostridia bacterium]|jgi:TM2 domain-containing membrane protein YozV|nr:hypothetical protein [Clostridia bacterium]
MFCARCGNEMSEETKFCPNCGEPKKSSDVSGEPVQYSDPYVYSGQSQYNDQSQYSGQGQYGGQGQYSQYQQPVYNGMPEQKSKVVAGLLQIFLGGFGVGRFYLGYTGIGVAQLLVSIFTCGLGAIWPFVDGILILCGQVPYDAKGVPLKD